MEGLTRTMVPSDRTSASIDRSTALERLQSMEVVHVNSRCTSLGEPKGLFHIGNHTGHRSKTYSGLSL